MSPRSGILLFLICFSISVSAIIPPAPGVKTDENFRKAKLEIEKSYKGGYFASYFQKKAEIREKVSRGILPASALTVDTVFALTLLGKYSDYNPIYSTQSLQNQIFDGPTATGTGTVTDYYREVSYNQMHFTGSCRGWYGVPGTMASYVGDNNGLGVQGGPKFVLDVIQSSDNEINYADYIQYYDSQGNPRIGFIAVIHTGADAAAGANNIWSHRWTFTVANNGQPYTTNDIDPVSGRAVVIDGDYAIQPELKGSNNSNGAIIDIGVFAHEFGHIFGLPDLYDTDNSSAGLGNWCLMAGGSYGGDGGSAYLPVHMSAWCKKEMGWVTVNNVSGLMMNQELVSTTENPNIIRIWRGGQTTGAEYFLVENRQKTGFDSRLYSPGLLIYHIDETRSNNTNDNRRLVDLEQADGLRQLNTTAGRGDAGDPFPGATNNRRFDQITNPKSDAYTSGPTYVSVRNIRSSGSKMIADYDVGTIPYIKIKGITLTETVQQDGRVEQGEIGNLNITITNIEPVNAQNCQVQITVDDPGIDILSATASGSVNALSDQTITITSALNVKPEFVSKMLTIKYVIQSPGNTVSDSIRIAVGKPAVLFVSRSEFPAHSAYYDTAFEYSAIHAELDFTKSPQFFSDRDVIIYSTGSQKDSLFTASEIDSLTHFLQDGGRLLLTGQNIAEYLKTSFPDFLYGQIGARWVKNNGQLARNVYGIASDILGVNFPHIRFNGTDGAGNERLTDVLADSNGFTIAFSYKNTTVEGAGGWKRNPDTGSKIILLGFGFESINNNESAMSRNQIMRTLLTWLDVPTSIDQDLASSLIADYELSQNYPNPFNPSTTIRYTVPAAGKAAFLLYNANGEQIAGLFNGDIQAGSGSIELNAEKYQLASGIYFVRMISGSFSKTIKITLVK
ncbi:MAG: M6 family metalloprotease domain-containing protein [Ignavibacteriaceae bacterium]|nr:M6 family metalloprotease domain-containing protein [Ignavibacteriaceae bacterium]